MTKMAFHGNHLLEQNLVPEPEEWKGRIVSLGLLAFFVFADIDLPAESCRLDGDPHVNTEH